MNRQKAYLVAATLIGVVGLGYGAYAQTGTAGATPPRLIPFQGYLEDANGPVNGAQNVTFFITNGPAVAHSATCNTATCMWAESQSVQFSNGYFSAALGSSTPFTSGAANLFTPGSAESRYVRVRIGSTTLDGAQRILSSPFAITAETAANFAVTGVLSAGSITTGAVTATSVTSSGNVQVNGTADVRAGGGLSAGSTADVATGNVSATADVLVGDGLRVGSSTTNPGVGDVVASGDITLAGALRYAPQFYASTLQTCFYTNGTPQDAACTTPLNLGTSTNRVCFLAEVRLKQDSADQWGICNVYQSGSSWFLQAGATGGDADARCRATCIVFN